MKQAAVPWLVQWWPRPSCSINDVFPCINTGADTTSPPKPIPIA